MNCIEQKQISNGMALATGQCAEESIERVTMEEVNLHLYNVMPGCRQEGLHHLRIEVPSRVRMGGQNPRTNQRSFSYLRLLYTCFVDY